jgi:hypothetical protein
LPFAQAFGIGIRQAASFYSLCGFFYVIVKADKFDLDAVLVFYAAIVADVQEDVTSLGIAVFGFADRADIDGVAEMVLAVGAVVKDAVEGQGAQLGAPAVVTAAADTEVVVAGDGGDASFADFVDDFVGIPGRAGWRGCRRTARFSCYCVIGVNE